MVVVVTQGAIVPRRDGATKGLFLLREPSPPRISSVCSHASPVVVMRPQSSLAARAALPGLQAQPSRELAAALELVAVAITTTTITTTTAAVVGPSTCSRSSCCALVLARDDLDVAVVMRDASVQPVQLAEQIARLRCSCLLDVDGLRCSARSLNGARQRSPLRKKTRLSSPPQQHA
jgi:hypothetical protein